MCRLGSVRFWRHIRQQADGILRAWDSRSRPENWSQSLPRARRAASCMSACVIVTQLVIRASASMVSRWSTTIGRKPLLMVGFGVLPVRGVLYTLTGCGRSDCNSGVRWHCQRDLRGRFDPRNQRPDRRNQNMRLAAVNFTASRLRRSRRGRAAWHSSEFPPRSRD